MSRFLLVLAVLPFLVAIILLRTPDTDRDEMLEKYTNPHSSFIGGESGSNVHYRDQGMRNDTSVLPSAALSFNERIKRSEILILTDVGHLPMLEAPVDAQAAIEQFLDESLNSDHEP